MTNCNSNSLVSKKLSPFKNNIIQSLLFHQEKEIKKTNEEYNEKVLLILS